MRFRTRAWLVRHRTTIGVGGLAVAVAGSVIALVSNSAVGALLVLVGIGPIAAPSFAAGDGSGFSSGEPPGTYGSGTSDGG